MFMLNRVLNRSVDGGLRYLLFDLTIVLFVDILSYYLCLKHSLSLLFGGSKIGW